MEYKEGACSRFENPLDWEDIDFQSFFGANHESWYREGDMIFEGDEFMGYCVPTEDEKYPFEARSVAYKSQYRDESPAHWQMCASLQDVCKALMSWYGRKGGAEDFLT